MDLGQAMERAQVLDWGLQEKLRPYMSKMRPRRSIYIPEFIAANQEQRVDNVIEGTLSEQVRFTAQDLPCVQKRAGCRSKAKNSRERIRSLPGVVLSRSVNFSML